MQSLARETGELTLAEHCVQRLRPLCTAVGLEARAVEVEALVRRLMSPWGDELTCRASVWPSPVGDDGTPFEFSLSLGGSPELRILIEPLGNPPSLAGNRKVALALLDDLARDHDVELARLDAVRDLFLPAESRGAFAPCLAVGFTAAGPPQCKLYLDPGAHGRHLAAAVVEEALVRLGFESCWPVVAGAMMRGPELDEVVYFSLDLARSPRARVKIYVRHHGGTIRDLERAASSASWYRPGEVSQLARMMAPDCNTFHRRAPLTCFAFNHADGHPIAIATTHIPVHSYAPDDATIERRVRSYLALLRIEPELYSRALRAYANRGLHGAIGMQSYVSLRGGPEPRISVYLAAEAYRAGTVAEPVPRPRGPSLRQLVDRFEGRDRITHHPFLRRLRREPVHLPHLWRLLASFQISISQGFAKWLAGIVARVDDDRIRCVLADQLNDELGRGVFERAHVRLFAQMMDVLAPFRPPLDDDDEPASLLAPGRALVPRLAAIYCAPDPFESVGAVIAGEIFGKQIDQFLGEEFRRQTVIDPRSLAWLTLHETLEVAHADASRQLADLVPAYAADVAQRGAIGIYLAGWAFLDALYASCYGGA
jgi:DMATS type aromatic prenyltransferase